MHNLVSALPISRVDPIKQTKLGANEKLEVEDQCLTALKRFFLQDILFGNSTFHEKTSKLDD